MTIARRALFGKLNLTLFRGIESATAFAKLRGNPYVELTHWIHQLWQLNDCDLHRVCRHYKVDSQAVEKDFAAALSALPSGATALCDFSHHIETVIERAWVLASLEFGDRSIRGAWLLSALLQTPELRRALLNISPEFQRIPESQLAAALGALIASSPEEQEGPHDGSGLTPAMPGEATGAMAASSAGSPALEKYCTDLTERARSGQIDPVIGRAHEIRTMVDILLRRRQNNPLLTGEAGVGKTAVVEGREEERKEEAGCAGGMPLPVQLIALEQDLVSRQQNMPLIFSQVDESVVAAVVADWTGIPVGRMVKDDVAAIFSLQPSLEARVIGQDHALAAIAERVQIARARLADPHKPVGVFLLVGPSGVGKTETALALAQAMYGGEQNLITINMGEFQEPHTVSTLKGSPPGYVGYGEGGVLTEAVRRKPYSVILLDEIEKAHPDVHEIFYQVFDKGWMEDGEGRHIDFRNTTILLTSNTGSELISALCDGAAVVPDVDALRELLQPVLRTVFPAAFLGRLSVVPYFPLGVGALADIVALHLARVVDRMKEQHGIDLTYTSALVAEVSVGAAGAKPGLETISGLVNEFYTLLVVADTALAAGSLPPGGSEVGARLKLEAGKLPAPFREVLTALATSGGDKVVLGTAGILRSQAQLQLDRIMGLMAMQVSEPCKRGVEGRYPLAAVAQDASIEDFTLVFSVGGAADEFFNKYLASYVDTSVRPWRYKDPNTANAMVGAEGAAQGVAPSPATTGPTLLGELLKLLAQSGPNLEAFYRAQQIRDLFFRDAGGKKFAWRMDLRVLELEPGITDLVIDIDGQGQRYVHGPVQALPVSWPGPRGGAMAEITANPRVSGPTSTMLVNGPWALFRLLEKGRIVNTATPGRLSVEYIFDGRKALIDITAASQPNPLGSDVLKGFRCPGRAA